MQQERDDLHSQFVNAILELQQKTGLKNVLLEKKLAALNDLLEQKEAQINEVLAAAHLDPTAMSTVNKKLEVHIFTSKSFLFIAMWNKQMSWKKEIYFVIRKSCIGETWLICQKFAY